MSDVTIELAALASKEKCANTCIQRGCVTSTSLRGMTMAISIAIDREEDGRWIAEVSKIPGVLVYGKTKKEAIEKAKALSLRVLADRLEHGEKVPDIGKVFSVIS